MSNKAHTKKDNTELSEEIVIAKPGCLDGFTGNPVPPGTEIIVKETAKYHGHTGYVYWVNPIKDRRKRLAVRSIHVIECGDV